MFLTAFYCTLLLIWTEAPPISRLSLCPVVFPRGWWSCLFAVWLGGVLQRWKTLTWPQRWSCQPKTEGQTIKKNPAWPSYWVHKVSLHTVSCSWTTLFHFCSVTFPAAKRPKGSSSSLAQWNRLRLRSDWQTANTPPLRPEENQHEGFSSSNGTGGQRNPPSLGFMPRQLLFNITSRLAGTVCALSWATMQRFLKRDIVAEFVELLQAPQVREDRLHHN